jgi:hypothetical protein
MYFVEHISNILHFPHFAYMSTKLFPTKTSTYNHKFNVILMNMWSFKMWLPWHIHSIAPQKQQGLVTHFAIPFVEIVLVLFVFVYIVYVLMIMHNKIVMNKDANKMLYGVFGIVSLTNLLLFSKYINILLRTNNSSVNFVKLPMDKIRGQIHKSRDHKWCTSQCGLSTHSKKQN